MTAFIGSFLQYLIIMLILAIIAFAGAVTGKKLRENKDEKEASYRPQINQGRR